MDALANWIWQGSVVAIAAAAILRTRRISATTRGRAWWIALTIVLAMPIVRLAASASSAAAGSGAGLPAATTTSIARFSLVIPEVSWWAVPLAILFCAAWGLLHLARIATALIALRRAKQACRAFPEDRSNELRGWKSLNDRGRRARLVLSNDVSTASVLGLTSPAIAVSPAIVCELTATELDGIVVHEWAHVQRRDDWARVVQLIVRAVAGWHPAVWWIDRQLHLERESACDDWAVNVMGSPKTYAASLTKAAALSTRRREPILLPSVLTSDLARRVVRVLDARRSTATHPRFGATAIVSPVLVLTALAVASVELVVSATPSQMLAPSSLRISSAAHEEINAPVSVPLVVPDQSIERARAPRPRVDLTAHPQAPSERVPPLDDRVPVAGPATAIPPIPLRTSGVSANELPGTRLLITAPASLPDAAPPTPSTAKAPTPWGTAADAGVGIGRGSQKAAAATAGFFTKLSKSIARSF